VLGFQRVEKLEIDTQGNLVLHTVVGPIHQRKPVIYQEVDGVRKEIPGGYVLKGEHQVSFKVAAYDASQPLVIDPVLRGREPKSASPANGREPTQSGHSSAKRCVNVW
jgi:hypothetical protein